MRRKVILISCLLCTLSLESSAQTPGDSAAVRPNPWSVHFQLTVVSMGHFAFPATYSGKNSMVDTVEKNVTSLTSTVFLGRKLWRGAAIYFNPEISGGRGLSDATGMAGFPNGETFRIGNPAPAFYTARLYIQQTIPLGHTAYTYAADDVNQVGDSVPIRRITLSLGKFSLDDFYDDNPFSHDPRGQFLNWSLMSNGAWDYPANTRGYTQGLVAELFEPTWAIRASAVMEPRQANGPDLDNNIFDYHGLTLEAEKSFTIGSQPGTVRALGFYNLTRAPTYAKVVQEVKAGDSSLVGIFSGAALSHDHGAKYGWGISANQNITRDLGLFLRASWNDGKTATWAFTEIDQSISAGLQLAGKPWHRPEDHLGGAFVLNGISSGHQAFLKAGLNGFMVGDGNLTYGHEGIAEVYYAAKLFPHTYLTADYQFCNSPGYNKDRGPINIYAIRAHIEF
jgi:high affinity Mn2+ porin